MHTLELTLADQRPELRPGVHRVAEADRRRAVEQPSQVLRVDAAVHVDALDRSARLAGTGGGRPQRSGDGAVEIGVVAHDRRVVAPELEDHALAVLARETPDALAVGDPAREADLRDRRRPADRLPGRAGTVDDAQHAFGQAGIGEHRGQQVPAERRVLGRLEDDAVPGHERHGDGPGGHEQRVVPGCDHADDAERPVDDRVSLVLEHELGRRDALRREDPRRVVADPVEHHGRTADVDGRRLHQRLAGLARDGGRQLVAAAEQHLGGLGDDATAFPERRRRPRPAGGRDLRGDRLDRVGRRHCDAAQGLAGRGIRRDEVGRFAVERRLARRARRDHGCLPRSCCRRSYRGVRYTAARPAMRSTDPRPAMRGGLSSTGRASDCGSEGYGFEPRRPPNS